MLSRERRERLADWLTVAGGVALAVSLFLTWSHQFSTAFLARWGSSEGLRGVPHDPTAWQVYSVVDVLLAMIAAGLVAVAALGSRRARAAMLAPVLVAMLFTAHALARPPTNGALVFDPTLRVPGYTPNAPSAGPGETVALVGLGAAVAGLLLSLTVEQRRAAPT